jgi:hypothetical protein
MAIDAGLYGVPPRHAGRLSRVRGRRQRLDNDAVARCTRSGRAASRWWVAMLHPAKGLQRQTPELVHQVVEGKSLRRCRSPRVPARPPQRT